MVENPIVAMEVGDIQTTPTILDDKSTNSRLNIIKRDLFEKLAKHKNDMKSLTLALTIQAMFKSNLEVLVQLFEFYKEIGEISMANDLCENDIFKNFKLNETNLFDIHLKKFLSQIILHLSKTKPNEKISTNDNNADEFYFKLYSTMQEKLQDKLIEQLLDKMRTNISFLKFYSETSADKKQLLQGQGQGQPVAQIPSIDFKEFYIKLAKNIESIFELRNLLLIFKKFIPEYGLYLIDSFLNIEKNFYTYLIQRNQLSGIQIDTMLLSIERRSLNIMRRLCIVELIPEFVNLIDKLDNRHCYRWIEKSLEFYCKYTINSLNIETINNNIKLNYLTVKLLQDSELHLGEPNENTTSSEEQIKEMTQSLDGLDTFQHSSIVSLANLENKSPFYNVYLLLDSIGKKLDWPTIETPNGQSLSAMTIEDKMTYLFGLKDSKAKTDKSISISSLNKQISFYGISYFFCKLIEFQAITKVLFGDMLVISQTLVQSVNKKALLVEQVSPTDSIDYALANLVISLKLWQKFNQHKEFLTIITKCLSNSKLDSLSCYKIFLSDYYNNFLMAFNANTTNQSYNSLSSMNLKQKIPMLANLFKHETGSFQNFFNELNQLIDQLEAHEKSLSLNEKKSKFYGSLFLSDHQFDMFQLDRNNLLKYFSKLFTQKIYQILEGNKKSSILKFLNCNDLLLGILLVTIQAQLCDEYTKPTTDLYGEIFLLIKSKNSFEYLQFFDYIYDVQILQDFYQILSIEPIRNELKLTNENFASVVEKHSVLKEKIVSQLNQNHSYDRFQIFRLCLKQNNDLFVNLFDQLVKF